MVERESECRGRGSVRAQGRPGSRRPDTAQSRRARAGLRVVGRWGVEGGSGSVSTDRVRSCSSRLDAHLVNRGALRGVPTPRVVAERTCDADAPATRDLFGRAAAARKTDMARRTVRVGWGGEEVKSDAGVRFRSFVRSRGPTWAVFCSFPPPSATPILHPCSPSPPGLTSGPPLPARSRCAAPHSQSPHVPSDCAAHSASCWPPADLREAADRRERALRRRQEGQGLRRDPDRALRAASRAERPAS